MVRGARRDEPPKAEQQVKTAKTVYAGTTQFAAALKSLAKGESVVWTHPIAGFEFPAKDQPKALDTIAKAAEIKLDRAGE